MEDKIKTILAGIEGLEERISDEKGYFYDGQRLAFEDARELIYQQFPELQESEDERIRKWLSDNLDTTNWRNDWPYTKQQVINYLEKQKEQPTNEEMLRTLRVEYEKGVADTIAKYEKKAQKPADEKSERVIKAAKRVLNNWLDGTDCPDVSGDFAELEHAIREYDGEERQKEQKPLSSEETELNSIAFLEQIGYTCIPPGKEQKPEIKYVYPIFNIGDTIKPKAYNKSHRINKIKDDNYVLDNGFTFPIVDQDVWEIVEQKPAGWSEEDWKLLDEMRDYLMSMCYSIDLSPNHIYEGFIDLIDRLKSPRPQPHWKPSEEQIYSLGTVVKGYDECTVGSVGYHLKEMYEQLKKLM